MSNHDLWDRIAGREGTLRAGDADRERIAERLRVSHAEGRLDLAEFQQRLERCLKAKTLGELGELVRDLPRQERREERGSPGRLRLRPWRVAPLAPVLLALIVISAASGHHVLWLWVPVLFICWRFFFWRRPRW